MAALVPGPVFGATHTPPLQGLSAASSDWKRAPGGNIPRCRANTPLLLALILGPPSARLVNRSVGCDEEQLGVPLVA
jgi:hypothetical protein